MHTAYLVDLSWFSRSPAPRGSFTVDGLTILDPKKNSGAILFGQLAPFYTRLKNELMDHIV